jgi:hypothetical protein
MFINVLSDRDGSSGGGEGLKPPTTVDPMEPSPSKNFCHSCFEEERLKVEDKLSAPEVVGLAIWAIGDRYNRPCYSRGD